jgi:glycolate dehydrogenase FAD-binding subunit
LPTVSEIESVAQASELLARASEERTTVSIGRSGGDVVLSTAKLDHLLEHEAGDLTCLVEAGVRLSELDRALTQHGQMFALDPPGDPTIGACLAANLSGPRRHRYGTMRDLVIGVTVVLGDGTVASSGGKVVKNVAGYDLGKLYCGSEGRLGLIARVALRLHPRPASSRTVISSAETPEDAAGKAQAVLRSSAVPSALDLLWPGRVAILFEGADQAVAAQVEAMRSLVGGREPSGDVWSEAVERQGRYTGRSHFAPGELVEVLPGFDEAIVRVAAGIAHVPEPVSDPRDPAELALVERIRAELDPEGVLV